MQNKIKKGDLVYNANAPTFKLHLVLDAYGSNIHIRYEHGVLQRNLERPDDGDWRKPKAILFNTPMVQAILDGRKTQTRRLLSSPHGFDVLWKMEGDLAIFNEEDTPLNVIVKATYQPGDILYVRETWAESAMLEYFYKANGDERIQPTIKWKPSIHMPKAAARIFLKVTAVKAERLQDITEADAIAEGIEEVGPFLRNKYTEFLNPVNGALSSTATAAFKRLWENINGDESWKANPYVFAYSFQRITDHNPQS
jgi:hypothetical protein